MFSKPKARPPEVFDDVASDRAKSARAAILKAADALLMQAVEAAEQGDSEASMDLQSRYRSLKWQSVHLPLDMIERGL